jgi:phosphomethylpyrimidine synthase
MNPDKAYKTQKEAARKGIITEEMKACGQNEGVSPAILMEGCASGRIVIPANRNHLSLSPRAIGEGLRAKINVNLGISRDMQDFDKEFRKVENAVRYGAHAIMDLSCWGDTRSFRKKIVAESSAMIGTVPIYDAVGNKEVDLGALTARDFLSVAEEHARDGVDFMTIHAGLNKRTAAVIRENPRLVSIVSRGGSLLYSWMDMTGAENPFFQYFEDLLEICREYDVTLSLGDGCRPGGLADAGDAAQTAELIVLGELTKRAWKADVQVMIEGPGHVPLNEVEAQVVTAKKLCHRAPLYVLGPIVTDIAPGYDHITSAIGGAAAVMAGADFLCYVTPAEHLRLPDEEDMKEGIMAALIASHAGDIGKNIPGAAEWDRKMSGARARLDWKEMFNLSLDPEKARCYRMASLPEEEDSCSMCGNMCAIRNMNRVHKGEKVVLLSD